MARRQVSVFIDGKQVEGTLKNIGIAKRQIVRQLSLMTEGSEEYEAQMKKLEPLNKVINRHRDNLRGVESTYDKMKAGVGRFVGVAAGAFAVTELTRYGKELFDLGASMELLGKKSKTVFGEALPQVTREAERNATAMGLTEDKYVSNAAAIGDLLIPMKFQREEAANISTNLVNLSGALSEWTGGQVESTRVSEILSKAMLGEREELKQLGISISEADVKARLQQKGLEKLTGEYLQQAKAVATLELITEKSTDAQTAFAENSDSLVRKQAELNARIQTVVAQLATALIPVFNRLVGVAESVANGIESVADFMGELIDPVKAAGKAVDDQAAKVNNLEKELNPLLDRYDELKEKSNLSAEEQDELSKIIKKVGDLTPTAVTQINEYGEALSINASASREFLEAEKQRLLFVNQKSIATIERQIELMESQARIQKRLAETGETGGIISVDLGEEEVRKASQEYANLSAQIKGARAELARLKGDRIESEPTANTDVNGPTPEQIAAENAAAEASKTAAEKARADRQREADRELKERQSNLEKLAKVLDGFREDQRLADLTEDEQKYERLRLSYQREIDLATELEAQGVKEAGAKRLELERLQRQALSDLSLQLIQEQTDLENEQALANEELRIQKEREYAERRAQVVIELNNYAREAVLSERELALLDLQQYYESLVAEAKKYGVDTLDVEILYNRERARINKEFRDNEVKDAQKASAESLNALQSAFGGMASAVQSAFELAGGEATKQAELSKALAAIQIGISSAEAMAKATASAAGVAFPGNIVAIASGIATVLGHMSQARKLLSDTPEVPQRYTGGYYDVRGQDDGRQYNARYIGRPTTGMLPSTPSLVLASERGREYFISHSELQKPAVVDHVRAIENIKRYGSTTSVPQFAEGGFTDTASGAAPFATQGASGANALAIPPEMMMVFTQLTAVLTDIQQNGIDAYISDDTLVNMQKRLAAIERSAGR